MENYTITKSNYTKQDVKNALSLHSMEVKFDNIEDQRIYSIFTHNSAHCVATHIIKIKDEYEGKLQDLIEEQNNKSTDENRKSEITYIKRCVEYGKKISKNRNYIYKLNNEYKHILVNLLYSYKLNKIIWLNRNGNSYIKCKLDRYFNKIPDYKLACLIFDTLNVLGYIDYIGFTKGTKRNKGKSSRYILSGICSVFNKFICKIEFIYDKPKNVVILKNDIIKTKKIKTKNGGYVKIEKRLKKLANYDDNKFTIARRLFINKINKFYLHKKIEVNGSNLLLKNSVLPIIYSWIIKKRIIMNNITLESVESDSKNLFIIKKMVSDGVNINLYHYDDSIDSVNLKKLLCQKLAESENLDYEKVYDGHVFIKKIEFEIIDKSIRSIFNRGSFDYGGRFYGSVITELPKILRMALLIDGEPVLSADFKAFHIYLAYHMAGEKCPMKDPYDLPGTNREEMKLASLVAINATDLDSAVFGTMKKINTSLSKYKDDASQITEEQAECLITTFMYNHKVRIASDYGVTLQNRDSIIMQDALDTLMDEGICGLGVHDEVVVPAKYIDRAVEVMIQSYKKQPFTNGFEPIVDVKRDKFEMSDLDVPSDLDTVDDKGSYYVEDEILVS